MRKSQYFPFWMFSAKQGHYLGTIFITSLVWRGPWLGIEPGTSRTRSQHYTTRLSRCWLCFLVNTTKWSVRENKSSVPVVGRFIAVKLSFVKKACKLLLFFLFTGHQSSQKQYISPSVKKNCNTKLLTEDEESLEETQILEDIFFLWYGTWWFKM